MFLVLTTLVSGAAHAQRAGITPDQKERLKALAMDTREKTMAERDSLRRARGDLFRAHLSYDLDDRVVKNAMDRISAAQFNLLNLHLDNQIGIRSILTEDQFNTFRGMMQRRGRGMGGEFGERHDDSIIRVVQDPGVLDSLGLDPDQKKRLGQIVAVAQKRLRAVEKMRRLSRQMIDSYAGYNLDSSAARGLIGDIHQAQVELLTLSDKTQHIIRSVLTGPQFQQLVQEIKKRMKDVPGRRGRSRNAE